MSALAIAPALRRRSEAKLLLFALGLAVAAQIAVSLAHDSRINSRVVTYGLTFAAIFGVAHVAIRRLAPHADPLILPMVAFLNGLGLAVITRLDLAGIDRARALRHTHLPTSDAPLQLAWTAVGVLVFITVLGVVRDHRILARYGYTLALFGLVLLLLPSALPARFSEVNGSRSWIRFSGFSLQPSEVAKLALLIFFASFLVTKRDVLSVVGRSVLGVQLPRGRDLGPVLVAWFASMAVLVQEKDVGMSMLFFGIFITMLYVATERISWVAIGGVLFVAGTYTAYLSFAHVRERFDIWLHPFADPSGSGYQLVQGFFGFATGGVLGTGLGRGQPSTVPFARTDFIIAAIGEELGLVGVMAVVCVYLLLVARGLRASLNVRDSFGQLLACGLAISVALQVFVVVGGVMGLIPLTGLTLPFLAYGGSSLVANYAVVALILRVSHAARAEAIAADVARQASERRR